uniref:Uncharacterized protein n=1 Tax=Anopheles quadriannulatus TaxID=34691 RepID=A0A182XQ75_ANOQN
MSLFSYCFLFFFSSFCCFLRFLLRFLFLYVTTQSFIHFYKDHAHTLLHALYCYTPSAIPVLLMLVICSCFLLLCGLLFARLCKTTNTILARRCALLICTILFA